MNKQEAIEKIKQLPLVNYSSMEFVEEIIGIVNQIHEPQKVVVPKFVAEWIEKCKRLGCSFRGAISSRTMPKEVDVWLSGLSGTKNILTNEQAFCSAWFYGYEIEQERLYTVEIPNPNATHDDVYILGRTLSGSIAIWRSVGRNGNKNYDSDFQLTESEIKQDFEWAWDAGFAKEVEEDK